MAAGLHISDRGQRALGANQTSHLWLKFLLETSLQYESLEPLIDFLAFLVTKLWLKTKLLGQISK